MELGRLLGAKGKGLVGKADELLHGGVLDEPRAVAGCACGSDVDKKWRALAVEHGVVTRRRIGEALVERKADGQAGNGDRARRLARRP